MRVLDFASIAPKICFDACEGMTCMPAYARALLLTFIGQLTQLVGDSFNLVFPKDLYLCLNGEALKD